MLLMQRQLFHVFLQVCVKLLLQVPDTNNLICLQQTQTATQSSGDIYCHLPSYYEFFATTLLGHLVSSSVSITAPVSVSSRFSSHSLSLSALTELFLFKPISVNFLRPLYLACARKSHTVAEAVAARSPFIFIMSTLISKPETIIKPETPMPSPMVKPPTPSDISKMNNNNTNNTNINKATGFAAPLTPSSTKSDTPPKSPVQSKTTWPTSSNPWPNNVAPGSTRYQATQNYNAPVPRQQQGLYALDRGDGTVSRLIPADELPFDIVGVPRREAPGDFNVVYGQSPQGPPYQAIRMDHGRIISPPQPGLGLVRMDYQAPQSMRAGLPYEQVSSFFL